MFSIAANAMLFCWMSWHSNHSSAPQLLPKAAEDQDAASIHPKPASESTIQSSKARRKQRTYLAEAVTKSLQQPHAETDWITDTQQQQQEQGGVVSQLVASEQQPVHFCSDAVRDQERQRGDALGNGSRGMDACMKPWMMHAALYSGARNQHDTAWHISEPLDSSNSSRVEQFFIGSTGCERWKLPPEKQLVWDSSMMPFTCMQRGAQVDATPVLSLCSASHPLKQKPYSPQDALPGGETLEEEQHQQLFGQHGAAVAGRVVEFVPRQLTSDELAKLFFGSTGRKG